MKVAVVVGTRPEIIKMGPVIRELMSRDIETVLIHTNQHYSAEMDQIFFTELNLPAPKYNLNVTTDPQPNQIGTIINKIDPVLQKETPSFLLVQGDTNSVVAAAMAAEKLGIQIGHVEAGLRSWDRTMPEETNRVLTDHLSTIHFAVTQVQRQILLNEGINAKSIHVVGNTIVDAVNQNIEFAKSRRIQKFQPDLITRNYGLVTAHRASNVDSKQSLQDLISCLEAAASAAKIPLVWPMHPRTEVRIKSFGLKLPESIRTLQPLGYLDFTNFLMNARFVLTDSGGVQEEACILGIPCITLRDNTERPETLTVGANRLVGRNPKAVSDAVEEIAKSPERSWLNPFGDGFSAKKIVDVVADHLKIARPQTSLSSKQTISVVGLGYMGLPTACLFAEAGHKVNGFDINQHRVDQINQAMCPFDEPGLKELLAAAVKSRKLTASNTLQPADVYIIALPTPAVDKRCDLSYVKTGIKAVAKVVKDGDLVILESTVKPGTCKSLLETVLSATGKKVHVAHCPERAIPGNTLHELINNDRVVGASSIEAAQLTRELYKSFCRGEIFVTDTTTAEAVKLMENTYRDVNIALANEMLAVSRDLEFNVWEAIALANKHPRVNYLTPGPGVGGHCIAVDPWFLAEDSPSANLVRLARTINDARPYKVASDIADFASKIGAAKIGILGVAYKKNVDDARESPAETIFKDLVHRGFEVRAHDPHVVEAHIPLVEDLNDLERWADLCVVVTDHDFYVSRYSKTERQHPFHLVDTRHCIKGIGSSL
jgi:UDP-N-acetylglucosamine 2-epimerase (non-hydrolysing)